MGIFGKGGEDKQATLPPKASPTPPAPVAGTRSSSSGSSGSTSTCVVGARTRIKGELTGDEDVVIEGKVEGEIRIQRDLRIAAGGVVMAGVAARSVVISGELQGDCSAQQRVEIQASGRLIGNIKAPRIVIAEGAVFRGTSDMSGEGQKARAAAS